MLIAGLERTSTVDFPGRLSAVIFTPGCNFRCFYCHNRHLLGHPPLIDEEDVRAFLSRRRGLLDGIVFSGGEPTLQKDLAWWLNYAKKLGFATKLDTNGSRPGALGGILNAGLLDYVAMDYKAPLDAYASICFAPSDGVLESLCLLERWGGEYELRTTVVPQLTMDALTGMANAVPPLKRWVLQPYDEQPGDAAFLGPLRPYAPAEIRCMADALRALQPNIAARC